MKNNLAVIVFTAWATSLYSVSIVYNFQIQEITKNQKAEAGNPPYTTELSLVTEWFKKGDNSRQFLGAGMASFMYGLPYVFLRGDFAAGYVSSLQNGRHFSRTQADDFLITSGYNFSPNECTSFTVSGILGIPLHTNTGVENVQLGTGHYGLGVQGDRSYTYSKDKKHAVLVAARLMYFVPRTIEFMGARHHIDIGCWTDLLFAHRSTLGNHACEFGYNPTIIFNTSVPTAVENVNVQNNYTSHSFYGDYEYSFTIKKVSNTVAIFLSYEFDCARDNLGDKADIMLWGMWSINF